MKNLKIVFNEALTKKGVTASKMCEDLSINEPTYYRAIERDSMKTDMFDDIRKYLEIPLADFDDTYKNESSNMDWEKERGKLLNIIDNLTSSLRLSTLGKFRTVLISTPRPYFFDN